MKNSTLINIVLFGGIIGWLLYLFTYVMVLILISLISACLFVYIATAFIECLDDYDYPMITKEYNIFFHIGRFFRWLDSKPRIIKPTKKNWRTPDNWDNEI